jgi:hypothetical protein
MLNMKLICLLSFLLASGCAIDEPFFTDDANTLITITGDKNSITADGQDILTLDITLKTEVDTLNAISITCNYGFLDADIHTVSSSHVRVLSVTPINRKVRVFLRADSIPPVGDLIVQATLQNISSDKHFTIDWAFPDNLLVTPITDSFPHADSLRIGIVLHRNIASPTSGTQIYFQVDSDTATGASGNIVPYTFTNGATAFAYLKSTSATLGTIRLRSYVIRGLGDTLQRINSYRITQ